MGQWMKAPGLGNLDVHELGVWSEKAMCLLFLGLRNSDAESRFETDNGESPRRELEAVECI